MKYDANYYCWNRQDTDRPALLFYMRLVRRYFLHGRVLDYGSGTGHFLRRLSGYFSVDGFDISDIARQRALEMVPQAHFYSKLTEIPTCRYTGITSLHVLEHVDDAILDEVLKAWKRALVPGGRILCVMPERSGRGHHLKKDTWCAFRDRTHVNLKTGPEWIDLFCSHGFNIIKAGTDGLWDFPYTSKLRMLDIILNGLPTICQFILGRLILPPASGESIVIIAEV